MTYKEIAIQKYRNIIQELKLESPPLNARVERADGSGRNGYQYGETVVLFDCTAIEDIDAVWRHELAHWLLNKSYAFNSHHDRYFIAASAAMHMGWQEYESSSYLTVDALHFKKDNSSADVSNEVAAAKAIYYETQASSVEEQVEKIAQIYYKENQTTTKRFEHAAGWGAVIFISCFILVLGAGVI